VLLDGIDNNTMATTGGIDVTGINYIPSVDALAEFKSKLTTTARNSDAQRAPSSGATTKSGTNQLHSAI
jgi:hypothetical protein